MLNPRLLVCVQETNSEAVKSSDSLNCCIHPRNRIQWNNAIDGHFLLLHCLRDNARFAHFLQTIKLAKEGQQAGTCIVGEMLTLGSQRANTVMSGEKKTKERDL